MNYREEHMDELLFDYLEGNLSVNEAGELERELLTNNSLAEELEAWQQTTIKSDFYDTTEIETSVLNQLTPGFSIINYLNVFLFVSLVFLSGIQKENVEFSMPVSAENTNSDLIKKQILLPIQTEENIEFDHSSSFNLSKTKPLSISGMVEKEALMKPKDLSITSMDNIPIQYELNSQLPIKTSIIKPQIVSQKEERVYSKKEIKKLRKRRRNQHETPFIKGNIPYVVPMDSKNFY